MNQLNEKIRILRIQITAEEMQPIHDIEKLEKLRKELKLLLKKL